MKPSPEISEYMRQLAKKSHAKTKKLAGSKSAYSEVMSARGKLGGRPKKVDTK